MPQPLTARFATNWTSAAGALEGILQFLGGALPRHAVMGLTGHAWHTCLGSREGVVALPHGPSDLEWGRAVEGYRRTGWTWERFAAAIGPTEDPGAKRAAAVEWAISRLDDGRPLVGWDFHLHEFSVVRGYDRERAGFHIDGSLGIETAPFVRWDEWPSMLGQIELFAPLEPVEDDPGEVVGGALEAALECFAGEDGPADGQPRGTAALTAWADVLDGDTEVDRAGNAYTIAVLQAARLDGALFLANLADSIPDLAGPLLEAERAIRDECAALSPLVTLFPFPSGGHGNVNNAGLRRAAAMSLRRAAKHEAAAADRIRAALET